MELVPEVLRGLRDAGAGDVPSSSAASSPSPTPALRAAGVAMVFTPRTSGLNEIMGEIVGVIRAWARARTLAHPLRSRAGPESARSGIQSQHERPAVRGPHRRRHPRGLGDVKWLASRAPPERVQAVYAADDVPDTGPVETLAEDLGVPCHRGRGDLEDGSSGLEDIVDRHRGETVVVVRGGAATEPVLMLVDADGTSLHSLDENV